MAHFGGRRDGSCSTGRRDGGLRLCQAHYGSGLTGGRANRDYRCRYSTSMALACCHAGGKINPGGSADTEQRRK